MATTPQSENATFIEEIDINATQQKVHELLSNPENVARIIPHVNNARAIGNKAYQATYEVHVGGVMPLNFDVTYNVTDDQYPTLVTLHFDGNIQGTIRWEMQGRTHVRAVADYKFFRKMSNTSPTKNVPFMGKAQDLAAGAGDVLAGNIATTSRKDIQDALKNLKAMCEGRSF